MRYMFCGRYLDYVYVVSNKVRFLVVYLERHEERTGDWKNVCDSLRRHGPAIAAAERTHGGRVQAAHVGTHERTCRRAFRRKLKTQAFRRFERGEETRTSYLQLGNNMQGSMQGRQQLQLQLGNNMQGSMQG